MCLLWGRGTFYPLAVSEARWTWKMNSAVHGGGEQAGKRELGGILKETKKHIALSSF